MRKYCCRLDQEYIMAVVRNRSGIDAGEIDYTLSVEKFDNLRGGCLEDVIETLGILKKKCEQRLKEVQNG